MEGVINFILIPLTVGVLSVVLSLISGRVHSILEIRSLYRKNHLYALIMEDTRLKGGSIDDLAKNFALRDKWVKLKGIPFQRKVLLIEAGYNIQDAVKANKTFTKEELKVQAELRRN